MVMILGFLISFAAGWSIVATDALFRAEERPGIFRGTPGMILLLTIAGVGGLTIAGAVIWFLQSMISAAVLVILAGGMVIGGAASKKLHVNAAGRRQPDDGGAGRPGGALRPGLDLPAAGPAAGAAAPRRRRPCRLSK